MMEKLRSTTILTVRHKGCVALGGDGQVTLGNSIMKADAVKIRKLVGGKVIGSGGSYAVAAARALLAHSNLSAREIVQRSLEIASGIDIYTNSNVQVEELESKP